MSATMNYKQMRSYTHEDLINLLSNLDEKQLLEFSAKHGGYPVLLRMAFYYPDNLPANLMDADLIKAYRDYAAGIE